MAVPVIGGGKWLGKGPSQLLPRRTKTLPQSGPMVIPVLRSGSPACHVAALTSTSPSWYPVFPFPNITSSPRATPRLGAESRCSSIYRNAHTLGALRRAGSVEARVIPLTGLQGR